MRFEVDQSLPVPVAVVEGALGDPGFYEQLSALPKVGRAELLDQHHEGDTVERRVRYHFAGDLSSAVRRVIDPERLVWVDHSTYDHRSRRAEFRLLPEHYQDRFRCSGSYRLLDEGVEGCRRLVEGELTVRYPLVGRAVEHAIVSGLREHLEDEAGLLRRWDRAGPEVP
jgi:hypothetical protein